MAEDKKQSRKSPVKEKTYSKTDNIYADELQGIGSGLAGIGSVGMKRERIASQAGFEEARAKRRTDKRWMYDNIREQLRDIVEGGSSLEAVGRLSQGRIPVDNFSFAYAIQEIAHEQAELSRQDSLKQAMNNFSTMNSGLPENEQMSQRELFELFAPQALAAANEVYQQATTNINNMLNKGLDHIREVQPPEYFEERPEETQLAFAAASQFATAIGSVAATATGSPEVGSAISQGGATAFESMGKDMNEQAKANRLLNQKLYDSYSSSVATTNEAITDLTKKALEELSETDRKHIKNTLSAWEKRQENFIEMEKQKLKEYKAYLNKKGKEVDQNYKRASIGIKNKEAQIKSYNAQSDLVGKILERNSGAFPKDLISRTTAINYKAQNLAGSSHPDLVNAIDNKDERKLVADGVAEMMKGIESLQNTSNGATVLNVLDEYVGDGYIPGPNFNRDTIEGLAKGDKNKQKIKEILKEDFISSGHTPPFRKAIFESANRFQRTIPTGEERQTEAEVEKVKREVAKIMSAINSRDTNRLTKLLKNLEGQEGFLEGIANRFTGKSFTDAQIKLLKNDDSRAAKKILSAVGK